MRYSILAVTLLGLSAQAAIATLRDGHMDTFNYKPVWSCTYETPEQKLFTIYLTLDKGPCPGTYEVK